MFTMSSSVAVFSWFITLLLATVLSSCHGYKPVLLVHGIMSNAEALQDLADHLEKFHPGTEVTSFYS